ncbi:UTRA domain-containing protein [Escherichia coli]|uniref:UTRA domain-containing protein n=1 Tax=Escherichia coli TaxID=562 RepID=UPI003CCBBF6B
MRFTSKEAPPISYFRSVLTREWSATKRPSISLPPPAPQAKWLKCELGEPLFRISKIAFDQNDKPVHVSELFCRANRITLTIDNKRH